MPHTDDPNAPFPKWPANWLERLIDRLEARAQAGSGCAGILFDVLLVIAMMFMSDSGGGRGE